MSWPRGGVRPTPIRRALLHPPGYAPHSSTFEMLNEIIQYEPSDLFSMEQRGRLATLGIEKGKSFAPDARMQKIFDHAAKQGAAMSRAILYASQAPDIKYWPERQWEKMFLHNTELTRNGYREIDARTLWHYQAIVVSPNLLPTTLGAGTAYLTALRDKEGTYLMGDRNSVQQNNLTRRGTDENQITGQYCDG